MYLTPKISSLAIFMIRKRISGQEMEPTVRHIMEKKQ